VLLTMEFETRRVKSISRTGGKNWIQRCSPNASDARSPCFRSEGGDSCLRPQQETAPPASQET